jgi:hypothetical protein
MSSVGMSLALDHLKGLACAMAAPIKPAKPKDSTNVVVRTDKFVTFFIKVTSIMEWDVQS